MKGWLVRVTFCIRGIRPGGLEAKITSTFIRTALCQSNCPEPSISPVQIHCSLSLLFLLLIVFLWFRLRTLGRSARDLRFLLHWLVRLLSGFLLRTGVLRIDILWVPMFLI
jgi:hypothetical protein